jgi:integrase
LRWSDINEQYINITGKNNRPRVFPLEPFPELRALIAEMPKTHDKVFADNVRYFQKKLHECLHKLNLYQAGKNFHSFRKTLENDLIHNQDFDMPVVAELLGHSVDVQKRHYLEELQGAQLNEKLLRNIAKSKSFAHQPHTENDK